MKICRISSTPSVMRPVRTCRWDCNRDEVPARAIPEIRAYSSSKSDLCVFQKSSSDTVSDSSTRYLCCDLRVGLEASSEDLVTAREVGSSSPKDLLEVFPVWRRDSLPAAVNFRLVPAHVDLLGVAKDCNKDECCEEKSLSRSVMSLRIRSSSYLSASKNVKGFPAPSTNTIFNMDFGWLAGLTWCLETLFQERSTIALSEVSNRKDAWLKTIFPLVFLCTTGSYMVGED
mmetsp:Transcript_5718/g.11779  ORF Transcript_5718/g.11779 Transcript_5718/m.11779 type:complete len:230 (-) Transcript_5718:8-697(-)